MTRNHGYETPQAGTTEWHIPLNRNFEQLDTDIEVRDAESKRGDYEPKSGAKFFATDTGAVYIGDGSNWNRVGSGGPVVDTASATGDGSTRVFALPHSLGSAPSAAFVQAKNEAASAGFWTNPDNHTDSEVEIEYSAAPGPDATLEYVIMTVK